MKPLVPHQPHHGAKYYLGFAGAMLVIAMVYALFTLASAGT